MSLYVTTDGGLRDQGNFPGEIFFFMEEKISIE